MNTERIIVLGLCYACAVLLICLIAWPAIRDRNKPDERTPGEREDDNAW